MYIKSMMKGSTAYRSSFVPHYNLPNKQHFRVKDEQIRFREMCLKQNFGGRGVVAKTGAAG